MRIRLTWAVPLLIIFLLLAGAALLTSCDSGDSSGDLAQNKDNLIRMEDCDEALAYLQGVEIARMERIIDAAMEDPWGWYGDDDDMEGDDDMGDDDGDMDDDQAGDDDSGGDDEDDQNGDDHSDTNVQEEGVDEADIVKTDGEILAIVTNGHLLLFDPKPADETRELGRLAIDGVAMEMFLYKNYVMVFSYIYKDNLPEGIWPDVPADDLAYDILKLTFVDISDPSSPAVIREDYLEGIYLSSRRVDNATRVAAWTAGKGPVYETWIDPSPYCDEYGENCDMEALRAAYEALKETNRELILEASIEDWMPRLYQIVQTPQGEQVSSGFVSECEDLYRPVDPQGTDTLSIVSIDMENPTVKQTDIGLIASGTIIYASSESLYVTTDLWQAWDWFEDEEPDTSLIHKFDIASSPREAIYKGSGEIDGWVLNQFSMSEYNGYLRVASTIGFWGDELSNNVFVLEQGDMELSVIGQLRDVAPGEEIKSARFLGDRGFLVTFEQTDPLFTLDLSDPRDPRVVGTLEMPGYSAYLHPFGDDNLLGFGLQGDDLGSTWGVKLTLFDVSDFADPGILFEENIGDWDSWSRANGDHKAFLYYEDMDLLAFPYNEWGDYYDDDDDVADDDEEPVKGDESVAVMKLYTVTLDDGFKFKHDVDHSGFEGEAGGDPFYGDNEVLRCAIIGDYAYSVSVLGLVVTDLDGYQDIVSIDLPYTDPYGGREGDDDEEEPGGDDDVDPE